MYIYICLFYTYLSRSNISKTNSDTSTFTGPMASVHFCARRPGQTRADPGFGRDGVRAPIAPSRRKEGGSMFIFLTTT